MTVVDEYLESPMEADDLLPCKGCGEILEEGKAFELAGNRWHLNCFRCHTCGTLLDSDANLLLLGDGSLICNNCTYSCSACGNKIEDLAILTGDQAFCASCFRCRNCKRKIENLRYARTSQGIFCMSCHESLMARRRKKSKAAAQAKAREKDGSPMVTEKSLPALPPNAIPPNAFSNDRVNPESDTPTELSPRPQYSRVDTGSRAGSRPSRSPERQALDRPADTPSGNDGSLSVPASSYRNNRNSSIISGEVSLDGDSFFIPVALDPSPAPSLTPRSTTTDAMSEPSKKPKEKEPYGAPKSSFDKSSETAAPAAPAAAPAPHIAFQTRQPSSEFEGKTGKEPQRKLSKSRHDKNVQPKAQASADDKQKSHGGKSSPSSSDAFKLQEAPKSKKLVSPRSNSQSNVPSSMALGVASPLSDKESPSTMPSSDSVSLLQSGDKAGTPRSSQDVRFKDEESPSSIDIQPPPRQDNGMRSIPRKELPQSTAGRTVNGKPAPGPLARSNTTDETAPAAQSSLARAATDTKLSDTYMQPRAPPAPPAHTPGKESMSSSANESPSPKSPKLPQWNTTGDFSMDEDMARILGTDEGSSSILRRVSKAVRHGRTNSGESNTTQTRLGHARSASETTRATASPRWPKTPIAEDPVNGVGHDISSPISLSSSADDPAFLKRQLRNSEQRVAELERQFMTEKDLRALNKKLIEKRKTVSVLDTQTEIMIRQLEVLAGYVERAKDTKQPIDVRELEDSAIKEFVQKLEKVKQSMTATIEALHAERDELIEDKNRIIAERDRALLEFEQLSSKNAQLADLNNDLTHQIQERFKAQADPRSPSVNTLGIYAPSRGNASVDLYNNNNSLASGSSTQVATDPDEPVLESGPTVVNIRKGQVRKFNWKKGSKTVAQNVAKGVKGAVGAFQTQERERPHQGLSSDNIGLPYNMTVAQVDSPAAFGHQNGQQQNRQASEGRQGFGFFKKNTLPKGLSSMNMSTPTIAEAPTTLFGSELTERAEYERRTIPSVVTRCIEEVELRGMDVEGIYRKTGGNSQVKMIQDGFERNDDFDISDPNVDITAVTSALKQYFRKLPTPLLTYDVYDRVLESNSIANEVERANHLRKTFSMLPQRHRDCLEFLMFHLSRVARRDQENLMSPKNLAVVFAPTIMRDHNIEREMTDMHAKNMAVQFIIEHSHTIFSEA